MMSFAIALFYIELPDEFAIIGVRLNTGLNLSMTHTKIIAGNPNTEV
jgi:hypothetical protein